MADYSNLFRSGGVSSLSQSPRRGGRGWKFLLAFMALCAITTFAIWEIWFSGDEESSKTTPKTATGTTQTRATEKPRVNPKALALYNKAVKALEKQEFVSARDAANAALQTGLRKSDPLWAKCVDVLGKANIGIISSDVPAPEKATYTIESGDTLSTIAKRFGTTIEAIQKSNGLDPANPTIYPGKTLRIFSGKWKVVVHKKEFRLYLYDGDRLFKAYTVGVGRQGRTPTGTFKIVGKTVHPEWCYNGKTIPYGDKENVLGTRWMALKPIKDTDKTLRGYGIHGTWQPESVGTECSNGCIRMKNNDVEELYSLLPYGTEVELKE